MRNRCLLPALLLSWTCRADVYKFDMGPEDSPVWPGFVRVGKDTLYSEKTGFGLRSADGVEEVARRDGAGLRPDDLCGDMILGAKERKTSYPKSEKTLTPGGEIAFCLDLPKGTYGVYYILGDSGGMYDDGLPFDDFYVTAEGERKLFVEVGEKLPIGARGVAKKIYYLRMNELFRPGEDLWEKYVNRAFEPREFTVEVNDGRLDLVVGNRPLDALIVYPLSQKAEAEKLIEDLTKARRKAWEYREYRVEYDREAPVPTMEEQAQGFIVFTPSYLESVPYYYVPRPAERKRVVCAFTTKGEFEPVTFAVLPLQPLGKCRARVSDLEGENGQKIAKENIDVRIVRHLERPFTEDVSRVEKGYYVEPLLLMAWPAVEIERGVVRQFWLTIKTPEDVRSGRYRGRITFETETGRTAIVEVRLLVLPFGLKELTDRFQAVYWYHDGLTLFPEKTIADLRDHGINVIHTPPATQVKLTDGKLSFDFSALEKAMARYRECGYPMRLVVSQSESCQVEALTGERSRIPGAHTFRPRYSERHKELTRQVVRGVVEEYKRRSWPELVFYCDGEVEPEAVDNAIQQMDLVEEGGGKASVNFLSWPGFVKALSHMSVPQFSPSVGWSMAEMADLARKAGKTRTWIYGLGYNRLERGFYFWKTGCEATAIEGYIHVYGDPYNEFDGGYLTWGEVWPSPDGPVPTTAWEWQREGIDDCKYLSHLTHLIAQARRSDRPDAKAAADEGQAEIEAMMATIHPEISHYRTGMRAKCLYNWDVRLYDSYRWRVAVQVLKLRRALGIEDDRPLARDLLRVKVAELRPPAPVAEEPATALPELQFPKGWQSAGVEVSSGDRRADGGGASLALRVKVNHRDRDAWPRVWKTLDAPTDLSRYSVLDFWARAQTQKKSRRIAWRLGLRNGEKRMCRYCPLPCLEEGKWTKVALPLEPLLVDGKGFSLGTPTDIRLVMYTRDYEDGDEVALCLDGFALSGRKRHRADDGADPLGAIFADW